jgi:hypothetical protein
MSGLLTSERAASKLLSRVDATELQLVDMGTPPAGSKCHDRHTWAATADRLRRQPRESVFISNEGQRYANLFTLASAARGGLGREGLIVGIETSFLNNGIYIGLVRDLERAATLASNRARWREAKDAFLVRCHEALSRQSVRHFDMRVPIASRGKTYTFDMATPEHDIIVQCRAFSSRFALSARMTRLRDAATYLNGVKENTTRLLIVSRDHLPLAGEETLAHCFVRLNRRMLQRIVVLELSQEGRDLDCIHGDFGSAATHHRG